MLALPTNTGGAKEPTLNELLTHMTLLLTAILDKLPRLDGNDRVLINGSEIAAAAMANLTTVTTLTGLSSLGAQLRPADAIPLHMSNAGAMHLYDRIGVS